MSKFRKLSHFIYRFPCHIVWMPKYCFRILEGIVKELLSKHIKMLLDWKPCELVIMHIRVYHIHLIVSIPHKISISDLMEILKRKTEIKIIKNYPQLKRNRIRIFIFEPEDIVLIR